MQAYAVCHEVSRGSEPAAAAALEREAVESERRIRTFLADGLVIGLVEGTEPRPIGDAFVMDVVIDREAESGGVLHALRYPIRAGMADIASNVFRGSGDPPLTTGTTRLLRTTVYRRGDVIVRLFAIDGAVEELIDGLAEAVEVHDVGRRMGNLFSGSYDFTAREGLRRFFTDNLMRSDGVRREVPA